MIRLLSSVAVAGALMLFAAAPARAQAETYELEKPHTQITFFADHLGFSKSSGRFLDFDGTFTLDRAAPDKSSAEVTIKTASLEMNHEKWNEHMKNADFFNVEKFPTMSFKSTAVKVTGEKTAEMTGDLTILGVTKPVTLLVTYNKSGQHPMSGKDMAGFSATGMLDRADWGMTYGAAMMDTKVELRIEVEGIKQGDEPTNQ